MLDFATSSVRLVHPSGKDTDLYFVRHGQTPANARNQFAGVTDVPLDELGQQQAQRVANRFREFEIDAIVSSPLQRAHYTAQAIASMTGHTPRLMDGLKEIDFGDAEMMTLEEILANYAHLSEMLGDRNDILMQWPNGESRSGFHERVLSTVNAILDEYANKRVAIVCHGGVISSILGHLEDGPRNDYERYHIVNCSVTHMSVGKSETIIHAWNDYSHLDDAVTTAVLYGVGKEDLQAMEHEGTGETHHESTHRSGR